MYGPLDVQSLRAENKLLLKEIDKLRCFLTEHLNCSLALSRDARELLAQTHSEDLRVNTRIEDDSQTQSETQSKIVKPGYTYTIQYLLSPDVVTCDSSITDSRDLQFPNSASPLSKTEETAAQARQPIWWTRHQLINSPCPICTDKISGFHYGISTCNSCSLFFKKAVNNKRVYTCKADKNCVINKIQRNQCQYCRFQKCLACGMKQKNVGARKEKIRMRKARFLSSM